MDNWRKEELLEAFGKIVDLLRTQADLTPEELTQAVQDASYKVPVTVYDSDLTPFEATTRYLYEKELLVSRIAELLGRAPSVVQKTLDASYDKRPEPVKAVPTKFEIPVSRYADKSLGFSEHLCTYLKDEGLTNAQISRIIGLDQRTVWTVLNRAEKKRGDEQ